MLVVEGALFPVGFDEGDESFERVHFVAINGVMS